MALPTLDATFASSADLPRKQMLAKWLVEELGLGSIADYYDLPERYLWAKIAVAAGGPKTEADYISLPKNYIWSDIYNAVSGSSDPHTDWTENVALGHIAAAYRGDTENPENLATYIDWPWRYQVASIISHLTSSYNAVIVSDAGSTEANGTYVQSGEYDGRPQYTLDANHFIFWDNSVPVWYMTYEDGSLYFSDNDVAYPWLATTWTPNDGSPPLPILTPTNV